MDKTLQFYLMCMAPVVLLTLVIGYWIGRSHGKRRMKRMAARTRSVHSLADIAIQPTGDGIMDLILSSKALKAIKRGQSLQTKLHGDKNSMVFRVRKHEV